MMRLLACVLAATLPVLLGATRALAACVSVGPVTELEKFPVCEASAAIEMPCTGGSSSCVWVADNEQSDKIFEYRINAAGRLEPAGSEPIPLRAKYGDIEALARDGDAVLAIGSHGRNGNCEQKDPRARIARVGGSPAQGAPAAGDKKWKDALAGCGDTLIALGTDEADAPARALRSKACAVIQAEEAAAEHYATTHEKSKDCRETPFNIEGAVSLADEGGARVWVGLRAPLVDGKALLLRLVLPSEAKQHVTFDGIAAIDLKGQGIRELTRTDSELWGISGSVLDSETEDSRLWRVPLSALKNGSTIDGVDVVYDNLPPTSEGLVVQPAQKRIIVLIDGGLNEAETACEKTAKQLTITLP